MICNIPCYARRSDGTREFAARIIGFAPINSQDNQSLVSGEMTEHSHVRAIVVFETFSRGNLMHVPLRNVRIVPKFHDEDEKFNQDNESSIMCGKYKDSSIC